MRQVPPFRSQKPEVAKQNVDGSELVKI